jgi:hypothetical protein
MVRAVLVVVSVLLVGACGGTPSEGPSVGPPVTSSGGSSGSSSGVSSGVTSGAPVVTSGVVAKTCTVPAVVGMVHQVAQDTMQASGLYVLLERDASGQGRLLVNDRNWVTTGQVPAAGSVVDCGVEVTLTAKKADE